MSIPQKIRSGDSLVLPNPIGFIKLKPNAEAPFKENFKDVGHQITVIERTDNRIEDVYADVNTFSTGLSLTAPKHYHLEIIEHPDLYKAGYMLVGGPRVINPGNTEEIQLPLYKYKEVEDIELPFRAALIILRQTEYAPISTESLKKGYEEERYQETGSYSDRRMPAGRGSRAFIGSGRNGMFSGASAKPRGGGNHMF